MLPPTVARFFCARGEAFVLERDPQERLLMLARGSLRSELAQRFRLAAVMIWT
jgi:hypothetical protein